ncbi:endolytic transglycosylase MltG [Paenibacillus sp. R14(2021)]|uniref:endolytic transglycosylase MltG n=1 Tax=Paenibacillus sp. R14(2021) TaxID=2859228 RepID=UPI0021589FD7|nr:endolytic transglycosylase MltG [Paenibacillus sp. R14(2021)]
MSPSEHQPGGEWPANDEMLSTGPRRGRITFWVIFTILGLMIVCAGSVFLYIWNGLRPAPAGDIVQVELKKGASPFQFAEVLEDQGIVRNAFIFKYYLRLKHEGPRFQAGVYELKQGMDKQAIIAKLNAGETLKQETIRFTIPEGFTVNQIVDTLSKDGYVDKAAFLALADKDQVWPDTDASKHIPKDGKYIHRLEGYMFPDTYELVKGSKPEDIIARMLQELDRKMDSLPENWEDSLAANGVDFHGMMTIASLVEREVVVDEERPIVAGIIYNRLKKGMPLQIDATVQYLLDKQKERLMASDLQVDSPFNTYKTKGLPPGPIASPSLKSIEASLFPKQTKYYYYVTKKDGSHEHLFAETLKGHNQNIAKSNATAKQ